MKTITLEADFGPKFRFKCDHVVEGIAVNPRLPENFSSLANEARPDRHMAWWDVPYIETNTGHCTTEALARWLKAWPSGVRYDVRCLDGGAWDRPTCWGMFKTMAEAVNCTRVGAVWLQKEAGVPA